MKLKISLLIAASAILFIMAVVFISRNVNPDPVISSPESDSASQIGPASAPDQFSGLAIPLSPAVSPTPTPLIPEIPLSSLQISPAASPTPNPAFDGIILPSPTPTPGINNLIPPGQ